MKKTHSLQLRQTLAREAARLMYEEGEREYFNAKRRAAKRLLGQGSSQRLVRYKPKDLPSNGEIKEALLQISELHEGKDRERLSFAMRVIALEVMEALASFRPRLIGSVSTGHARCGSDIDLHVFCDRLEELEARLQALAWPFQTREVCIRKGNTLHEYTHLYLQHTFPIELSVYPPQELKVRSRSSTDGKPIVRVKPSALLALLQKEHAEAWTQYQAQGEIVGLDELLAQPRFSVNEIT